MLWGRAANRCSLPNCRMPLMIDEGSDADETNFGEECHIIGKSKDGPRGDHVLSDASLDSYQNLILLCRNHHKLVDDNPDYYTVDMLKAMKANHEEWVRTSLDGFDANRQRDEETYAEYVETWSELIDFDHWSSWTSGLLSAGQPVLDADVFEQLGQVAEWLFARVWPKRLPQLEDAFVNFLWVLQDFLKVFYKHAERVGNILRTEKFYRVAHRDPELYEEISLEHSFHVDLVEDLALELTRAANFVCDRVRQYVYPNYRIKEGVVVIKSGPYWLFEWRKHRPEYREPERTSVPYPGLEEFKRIRSTRDIAFGTGISHQDPIFVKQFYEDASQPPWRTL